MVWALKQCVQGAGPAVVLLLQEFLLSSSSNEDGGGMGDGRWEVGDERWERCMGLG